MMAYDPAGDWAGECLAWRGRILTGEKRHWCPDWDYLPIDETCDEFEACTCKLNRKSES